MVRGLIIRRVFIWIDLTLVALMLLTVGMILKNILLGADLDLAAAPSIDPTLDGVGKKLVPLQERPAYDFVLFGDAGRFNPDDVPVVVAAAPVDNTPVETPLNLRLVGTTATSPTDRFASAIIEDGDQQKMRTYRIDDPIVDNVFLKEVYARYVIILNEREVPAQRQRLSMDDEKVADILAAKGAAPKAAAPAPAATDNTPETMTINRQELLQEVYMNYADLVGKVRPRMVRDESGQISGVTADNIGDIPVAKQLGITNGDVLQTVNNERIDSEQKIMEMVQKHSNSESIRIGILRNGQPKIITYRME